MAAPSALLLLTAVEALIATVGKPYPWLRGFVGDVLAVGWVYLVFRSFIRAGVLPLAAALLTGYAVEFGQYLAKLYGWQIKLPLHPARQRAGLVGRAGLHRGFLPGAGAGRLAPAAGACPPAPRWRAHAGGRICGTAH